MAKTRTYTALTTDRSGSMDKIKKEAEGGVNGFIDDLKEADDLKPWVVVSEFDTEFREVFAGKAKDAPPYKLTPRGMTALYDAIANTIVNTEHAIEKMDKNDRPEKVSIVIMTDGEENSSQEYKGEDGFERVTKLVKATENKGWAVVFLAGTLNAQQAAAASGMRNMTFDPNRAGQTRTAYDSASAANVGYLRGKTGGIEVPDSVMTDEQKAAWEKQNPASDAERSKSQH